MKVIQSAAKRCSTWFVLVSNPGSIWGKRVEDGKKATVLELALGIATWDNLCAPMHSIPRDMEAVLYYAARENLETFLGRADMSLPWRQPEIPITEDHAKEHMFYRQCMIREFNLPPEAL